MKLCVSDRAGGLCDAEARALHDAVDHFVEHGDIAALHESLAPSYLRGRGERYEAFVASSMCRLETANFEMGTLAHDARHFCGEAPRHRVDLSPFEIARTPVTNELFAIFDPRRGSFAGADRYKPVVDVTWLEASLFAIWVGCRLPTEAEWEYACGAGSASQWCCDSEKELARYAWYSENSEGSVQSVATRQPNALGLFDFHGNVWEWCADAYDAACYACSSRLDPFTSAAAVLDRTGVPPDRVCRGGSMHALAEMCRTRYRFHEPARFLAGDLGFRLARSADQQTVEEDWA
jgi:formylglycine-generating enzyme required for sulfatase activity